MVGPNGRLIEVQIRTHEMHNVAENGIAAHWRYKRGAGDSPKLGHDIIWLGQFSQDMQEATNPEEFMEALKVDLFAEQIVVFTPKGDLIQLPRDACIVDFAYKIHSEVGDHCRAGIVNGKFVSLNYPLQTGDRIEVITKSDACPSREWLSFVKTARARNKIRRSLMDIERHDLIKSGSALLRRELERVGIPFKVLEDSTKNARLFKSLRVRDLEELFVNVGFGRILTKHVISRLIPRTQRARRRRSSRDNENVLRVQDIDGYAYRRAQCCNPLPGDPIIGFVTKNRGISIHAANCRSLKGSNLSEERLIPLYWDREQAQSFVVEIGVEAKDRGRLLSDITSVISATGTNITGSLARSQPDGTAKLSFSLLIVDVDHLNRVINRIIPIEGVKTVTRRAKSTRELSDRPPLGKKNRRKPNAKKF